MTLTLRGGPLATRAPETVNYHIDGPPHRLFWHLFDRRVRALFAGEVVLDTENAKLLHESNLLPQLYVPREDVRSDLLEPTSHETHCPFKGDAAYFSVRCGDRVAENAVWHYPAPVETARWLTDHFAVHWSEMDAWFDEEDEVFGHIRDPYHRVDIRNTSRHVRVRYGETTIAETKRAKLLSETGLPNRWYIPAEDVDVALLVPSATHTVCPYKGSATYRSVHVGEDVVPDATWCYPSPLDGALSIAGYWCFHAEGIDVVADGVAVD